jgi:16S rRNA (adenine1518-N6/adenine1519-N6)-dimethyltransferase
MPRRTHGTSRNRTISPTRARLREWGVRPRKRFAQHFLTSSEVRQRIVDAGEVGSGDTVVEIGAGLGDLTMLLAGRAGHVVALELDRDLHGHLLERFEGICNVRILQEDALRWPLPDAIQSFPRPRKVVGNLPYNVGTQILLRFSRYPDEVDRMVLMFQKEVADRLAAGPDTPAYGGITLLVQVNWDVKAAFRVAPSAFHPSPKVESAVVVFTPLPAPRADVGDWRVFSQLVRAAFGQRRKTLRNALSALWPEERSGVAVLLDRAGIDGSRRGETLTLEEFARLSRAAQSGS